MGPPLEAPTPEDAPLSHRRPAPFPHPTADSLTCGPIARASFGTANGPRQGPSRPHREAGALSINRFPDNETRGGRGGGATTDQATDALARATQKLGVSAGATTSPAVVYPSKAPPQHQKYGCSATPSVILGARRWVKVSPIKR